MHEHETLALADHVQQVQRWRLAKQVERQRVKALYAERWERARAAGIDRAVSRREVRLAHAEAIRLRRWEHEHPKPGPLDTPAEVLADVKRARERLQVTRGFPAAAIEHDRLKHRVLRFKRVAPSVLRDPLLLHTGDIAANLTNLLHWCESAVTAIASHDIQDTGLIHMPMIRAALLDEARLVLRHLESARLKHPPITVELFNWPGKREARELAEKHVAGIDWPCWLPFGGPDRFYVHADQRLASEVVGYLGSVGNLLCQIEACCPTTVECITQNLITKLTATRGHQDTSTDIQYQSKATRETFLRMNTAVPIDFEYAALENVIEFLRQTTGANIVVQWPSLHFMGISEDMPITMKLSDVPALKTLELVLEQAGADVGMEVTYSIDEGVLVIPGRPSMAITNTARALRVDACVTLGIINRRMYPEKLPEGVKPANAARSWFPYHGKELPIPGVLQSLGIPFIQWEAEESIHEQYGSCLEIPDALAGAHRVLADAVAACEARMKDVEADASPALSAPAEVAQHGGGGKLPTLQPHDMQAWRLQTLQGMKQHEIANIFISEYGKTYSQGQISRMIKRAKAHAEANGSAALVEQVMPPKAGPAVMVDPLKLTRGRRTDGRRVPRRKNDDDD